MYIAAQNSIERDKLLSFYFSTLDIIVKGEVLVINKSNNLPRGPSCVVIPSSCKLAIYM